MKSVQINVLFDIKTIDNKTPIPIAILCIGHVNTFYNEPMLVETGWKQARPLADMVMENTWNPHE